jgi:peptide/nickel transport system permease protein
MIKYIIKRILTLVFLVFAVATMIFILLHLLPGDPVTSLLGEGASLEDVYRLREELNLDKPVGHRYLEYNKNLLNLSMGRSIFNKKKVITNIMIYLPNTLYLALLSMILALLLSFPLGVWAAFKRKTYIETSITFLTSVGMAIPNFVLGPLLIVLFALWLGLLPVSGSGGFKYIVLPTITLGSSICAFLTRIIRTSVGIELRKPYVLLARAKGLNKFQIFRKHILKNSMIPIVTTAGLQMGALLTGAIITETIFSWPGIGTLLINSINRRDYPMVQGLIIFITLIYILVNFIVDVAYFFLDPRIKNEVR